MNKYLITEANRQDLVSWLRQGNVQRVSDALLNLVPVSTLTAERDALKADAERYRTLRHYSVDSYISCGSSGEELDAEIDAAIEGEKP